MTGVSSVIFAPEGFRLNEAEKTFFGEVNPVGFCLFKRNIDTPDQVRALVDDLKTVTGRDDLAILVDQEGGRVQRLTEPHWTKRPPLGVFADHYYVDKELAKQALKLNVQLLGLDLSEIGLTVDCLPLLDVPQKGSDNIIGDRAFGLNPVVVEKLGKITCDALKSAGVLPVIKHIPGHGRAKVDSHKALPLTDCDRKTLEQVDFAPFKAFGNELFAMTAHVTYSAIDAEHCATFSKTVIKDVIRGFIGFKGLLMSDDIGMGALTGCFASRAKRSLEAGCDLVLHCSGDMAEMQETIKGCDELRVDKLAQINHHLSAVNNNAQALDRGHIEKEYIQIMDKLHDKAKDV
jgi:beta-N-acetylhexosaminidase